MIKKFISQSGIPIEVGDFYGSGTDFEGFGEVVSSFEEIDNQIRVNTNLGFYLIDLKPGDYIGMEDGAGKIVKKKTDDSKTYY